MYRQLYLDLIPIIEKLGFMNVLIVVVRLHWFAKRPKELKIGS